MVPGRILRFCCASQLVLAALVVGAGWPLAAMACSGPLEVRVATPTSIAEFLANKGMEVLTFAGYSGAEYESPAAMKDQAVKILARKDPAKTLINSGGTAQGIGAVYAIAKQKGFTTIGIVSSMIREQGVALSPCVDLVFVVKDGTWGGRLPGTHALSPTSSAIVANSGSFVVIGGGDVARDEVLAARQAGKSVTFFPAEMNHELARAKARKLGLPLPTTFRGSAEGALSGGDATPVALPQGREGAGH